MKCKIPKVFMELRPSKIVLGGVGVFAVTNIKKSARIAEGLAKKSFTKNLVAWNELKKYDKETKKKIMDFCIGTPKGFLFFPGLDFNELTIGWYFNHSCEGNIGFNKNGDFIAIRNIKKGEELTYDYGLIESNPKFIVRKCSCGSKDCRHIITGNDWKNKEFRKKNLKYMYLALRSFPVK